MSTSLSPVIKFRWFDGDGAPLNGGNVYTYAAGTFTPLATYSDYDGLVANNNPVILDAEGYADIRLSNNLYKFIIKDANDVTLITQDNVGNVSSGGSTGTEGGFGEAEEVDSGSIVDLGTIDSHFASITGTTTIVGFGSTAVTSAPIYLVKFQDSLIIGNSPNLITRMNKDIVTATGDHAYLEYLGSGIWIIFAYFRRDGSLDATTIICDTLTVTTTANLP